MTNKIMTQMDTDNFRLESDLSQLKKVIKVNAIEAIVFYSGRILEASSDYCVSRLSGESGSTVFYNLEYINDFSLLDNTTKYWADGLRRLSNQFRHILKPTEKYDGQIAVILLDMWLNWLINDSKLIDKDQGSFSLLENMQNDLSEQFEWVENWMQIKKFSDLEINQNSTLLTQPVFAAIICEELINAREFNKVEDYLQIALGHHPKDLRLNQLKGLSLSRVGKLHDAELLLQKLLKQQPNDDETIGILAGTIKRLWQRGDKSRLTDWGKLYYKGWKASKGKNTYLGINAATYSLWSGSQAISKEVATKIVHRYNQRKKTLKETLGLEKNEMNYWDLATYAESCLLAGLTDQAEHGYQQLFSAEFKNEPHAIPAKQLKQHLSEESIVDNDLLMQFAINHLEN